MTKDVLISIRGLQVLVDEEGVQEPVEVLNTGQYYFKNNQHYILYDEPAEGFEETTHNILKFNKQKLEVRKRGLLEVHMIFEENKCKRTALNTQQTQDTKSQLNRELA